jgi:hypothetical protein
MLTNGGSSWADAVAANGQSSFSAAAAAATKLLLWHWLQPALYFTVFNCYWAELDGWQQGFGAAVAVREALYVLTTLAGVAYNPAFLLVDVGATVRDKDADNINIGYVIGYVGGVYVYPRKTRGGYVFLGLYVLAPEKFVAQAAFGKGGADKEDLYYLLVVGGVLLDLCGVAALAVGLLSPAGLEPALAVGYGATVLGGLFMAGLLMAFWKQSK